MRIKIISALLILLTSFAISACSGKDKDKEKDEQIADRPAEQIYNEAWSLMAGNRNKKAIEAFEQVETLHPYSEWATRSKIMGAYAAYRSGDYDKALAVLENFVKLHPGNKNIAYAYYLTALCYYEQITDVGRDQKITQLAMNALDDVIGRFPDTIYARDARFKKDLVNDHLAGKEMAIGRYYQKQKQCHSAIGRFRTVVEQYQTTSHTPEAMHRLVECYMSLGVKEEARRYASVLGYNYPASEWYAYSYKLFGGPAPRKKSEAKPAEKETPPTDPNTFDRVRSLFSK